MTVALRYAARSDVGLVRTNNQDSAYAGPHLLMVADGMGGHAGGDVASSLAVAAFAPLDGESHGPDDALDQLEAALEQARDELLARVDADPELAGMGTTVIAILRAGNKLAMVHLGDSRGYLFRDGVLTQVTTDHTFVQHLVDIGRITPEEAEHHPQRSVVMRVLGDFDAEATPDLSVREARPGDRWLLCSDGLSGFVSAETIEETLRTVADVDVCADRLVQLALRAGGGDNVTVVLADVIELDDVADGAGPTTAAAVVGAAATTRHEPTSAVDGPAARAASLAQSAARAAAAAPAEDGSDGEDAPPPADPDDDDPAPRRRLRPAVVWTLAAVATVAVLALGYLWTQTQYFVADDDGEVVVLRGLPQTLGPVALSTVVERSGTQVEDLASAYLRERVEQTIHATSLEDARDVVRRLEDDSEPEPTPTPTPSPTATPTPTPPVTDPAAPPVDPAADPAAGVTSP
ncbi:PP2C family protein-serine/threonine phosphatase [Cellulomonas fimi]|uniref:Serine/threonine protein phosphatase PstP n=2 Tax=Cellulomonas fimi TaxID=1708 RepID=F4H3W1_CELFA|nr:PP2C family serine/threonine-protein phosphatase [Cellulomonas fimi]AEE44185.1 protein serine/threonine phosphatase [Cellulomonas fimi ATCC 484]VEH25836.1 PP2C-family Ser/Thr phosphatase [Cellulomonas fimi]